MAVRLRLHHRAGRGRDLRGHIDAVRNDFDTPRAQPEPRQIRSLHIRRHVDTSRTRDVAPLDERDPRGFEQPAFPADQLRHQHAPRRQNIRHAVPARGGGGGGGGPQEHRMQVHHVEACHVPVQRGFHARRAVQPAPCGRREIGHADSVHVHRRFERNRRYAGPVHVRRVDLDVVPPPGKSTAEPVNRIDGTAVPRRRQVAWHHVQDAHVYSCRASPLIAAARAPPRAQAPR